VAGNQSKLHLVVSGLTVDTRNDPPCSSFTTRRQRFVRALKQRLVHRSVRTGVVPATDGDYTAMRNVINHWSIYWLPLFKG